MTNRQLKNALRETPTQELIEEAIQRWEATTRRKNEALKDLGYVRGAHAHSAQMAYDIAHQAAFTKRWA